jgi:hypothetical protein
MTEILQPYDTVCWKSATIAETSTKGRAKDMCNECCQKPEKLKDKPSACTPEQIEQCHGKDGAHPCVQIEIKKR